MATSSSLSQSEGCPSEENRQSQRSDSDSESSESVSLAGKKRSRPSRRHINSKYQAQWSTKYLGIKRSSKGAMFAFCTLCGVDISIAGGGVHQIKRHCANKKHCTRVLETTSQRQPTISQICTQKVAEDVCRAELCFARFIVEHNLPFAVADHFNKLVPSMFPDSKIAHEFACARTKAAALVTHALAPAANEPVVEALRKQYFTVLCDGGNDNFEKKYFGVMVKYWDNNLDKVVTRFLDAPVCNIATGESLFNALAGALETRQVPWENLIGFASDSASVMVGKRNSVLSRVLLKQPRVFSMGCVCHLAALCAAAGLKKLPISIDDLLIDIYYHFKHSSKRCEEFSVIVEEFDGLGPIRILKHC